MLLFFGIGCSCLLGREEHLPDALEYSVFGVSVVGDGVLLDLHDASPIDHGLRNSLVCLQLEEASPEIGEL